MTRLPSAPFTTQTHLPTLPHLLALTPAFVHHGPLSSCFYSDECGYPRLHHCRTGRRCRGAIKTRYVLLTELDALIFLHSSDIHTRFRGYSDAVFNMRCVVVYTPAACSRLSTNSQATAEGQSAHKSLVLSSSYKFRAELDLIRGYAVLDPWNFVTAGCVSISAL